MLIPKHFAAALLASVLAAILAIPDPPPAIAGGGCNRNSLACITECASKACADKSGADKVACMNANSASCEACCHPQPRLEASSSEDGGESQEAGDVYVTCSISGNETFKRWAGFAADLQAGEGRCKVYASTHGGGACTGCKVEGAPAAATTWLCSGTVSCPDDKSCTYSNREVDSPGDDESRARLKLVFECARSHGRDPLEPPYCSGSKLKCKKKPVPKPNADPATDADGEEQAAKRWVCQGSVEGCACSSEPGAAKGCRRAKAFGDTEAKARDNAVEDCEKRLCIDAMEAGCYCRPPQAPSAKATLSCGPTS